MPKGWQGFFPYYAGFPINFAEQAITFADLQETATVFDPWNGSGTTTFAASEAGYKSIGFDLNPVMAVVARARTLSAIEADALMPIASQLIRRSEAESVKLSETDPLLDWFKPLTATTIRGIERSICHILVGEQTLKPSGVDLNMLSSIAAAFYVALFSSTRILIRSLKTTNPTWTKMPKALEYRLDPGPNTVCVGFTSAVRGMADALIERRKLTLEKFVTSGKVDIINCDSSTYKLKAGSVDFILTSPPYCTRLDYAQLTRVELAILSQLSPHSYNEIKSRLLGSIVAPRHAPKLSDLWGKECLDFLEKIRLHPSKASAGYYYRNHADYFNKLFCSLQNAALALKTGGKGIFVVQDSFYKDIHNPIQKILRQMLEQNNLAFLTQYDFPVSRSIASRHRHAITYRSSTQATESALCVAKQ